MRKAIDHQREHLALTLGKALVFLLHLPRLMPFATLHQGTCARCAECRQQLAFVKGLGQKLHRTCAHGLHRQGDGAVTGHEDDRPGQVEPTQHILNLQPAGLR
ncbi:hypothetical protein D3C81_1183180 [compost metagenome]